MKLKTLILYLSVTGNTEKLAFEIASQMEDVELWPIQLKTKIPKTEFWKIVKIGFLMWLGKGIKYSIVNKDIEVFDQVVVGTPVWMGRTALPVIDVVKKYHLSNKVKGVFATCGAEAGNVFADFHERTSSLPIDNYLAIGMSNQPEETVIKDKIIDFITKISVTKAMVLTKDRHHEG